jgi:hypothetical protein
LRQLGMELKIGGAEKITIKEDNQACYNVANGGKLSALSRHIDIHKFAIQDDVEQGRLAVEFVASEENVADGFTKPLSVSMFEKFRLMLGVVECPGA